MGKAARNYACEMLNIEKVATQYMNYISDIAGGMVSQVTEDSLHRLATTLLNENSVDVYKKAGAVAKLLSKSISLG
jgi:hypothetical protein